jgi:GNAT superfamily N-acetyltransferase
MDDVRQAGGPALAPVAIRPTDAGDDVARFGDIHAPHADSPRRRRSFVAVLDERVVGVTTGLASDRHPSHYRVTGTVDDDVAGRGIGTLLLDALTEALPDRPLLVMVPNDVARSRAFLAARGFVRVMRGWSGRINPDHALIVEALPDGFRIEPRDSLDEQLVELYDALYDECHWWIAPSLHPPGEPAWIELAGPLVPGSVSVALDPFDRPIGITSLHTGPFAEAGAGDVFMPPTAILEGGRRAEGRTLMAHLVSATLDTARRMGMSRVVVEVDDSNVELARVLGPLAAEAVTTVEAWANG